MDQLFSFLGDVGGDLRNPVQDREQGKFLAEPPQELSIDSKIGPQHLGDSKHILSMRYGVEDFPQPKRQSCSWHEPTESDIRFSESVKPSQGLVW